MSDDKKTSSTSNDTKRPIPKPPELLMNSIDVAKISNKPQNKGTKK